MKRIYSKLGQYMPWKLRYLTAIKAVAGKKLIVDGTILPVANVNIFWAKRQRKLYSVHYCRRVEFEEVYYQGV